MSETHTCQSCGMPIEAGPYCQYCADENGQIHSFDETVVRMSQFMKRETPGVTDDKAVEMTLEYMSQMPAWRDHPQLAERLKR
jgi:hypothetical protein